MKLESTINTGLIVWIVLIIAGTGGWVANIVKIFGMTFDPLTAMAVMRVIGVFVPPLGAVLGYL